ncbi:hypothetical protein PHJA_001386400 [Phtheirospermum japonicum]|uniref:Uncharacterized protein n=1 Tax=Phtheirospermum japonicum TaxID=374723 RepID=A0A830C2M2_9LAMI|nr:hypothetical protein PHJA_001386400 [Phtheirospermum japonicum]
MMSLVDYAASSDEDEPLTPAHEQQIELVNEKRLRFEGPAPGPSSNDDIVHSHKRTSVNPKPPSSKRAVIVSDRSSDMKLPDASFLLNSPVVPSDLPNVSDHSSRVAAAMAESAARKRELIGPTATYPRSKIPKGSLPHSKNVPDTVGISGIALGHLFYARIRFGL